MKIIDLLNKIANGEEVPEYIKYYDKLHLKEDTMLCYYPNLIYKLDNDIIDLNDEVEILDDEDEEKGLPEKIPFIEIEGKYTSEVSNIELTHKINEIIDYLEKQRKGN